MRELRLRVELTFCLLPVFGLAELIWVFIRK